LGKYQSQEGRSFCIDCIPGTFSNVTGYSHSCDKCPEGKYQPEAVESTCITASANSLVLPGGIVAVTIPLGSRKDCENNECTSFSACPSGYFGYDPPEDTCGNCPAGKTSFSGSLACISCAKGKFSATLHSSECKECLEDTYQDQEINPSLACTKCPAGYTGFQTMQGVKLKGQVGCQSLGWIYADQCKDAEYLNTSASDQIYHHCVPCPTGASCIGNVNSSQIIPRQGFYQCPNSRLRYTECRGPEKSCPGYPTLTNLTSITSKDGSGRRCGYGHASPQSKNPLCNACAPGFVPSGKYDCIECKEDARGAAQASVIITVLLAIVAFVILIMMRIRSKGQSKKASSILKRTLLTHMQMLAIIISLRVPWPTLVDDFITGMTSVVSLFGQTTTAHYCRAL
jgi:hypothetical protein